MGYTKKQFIEDAFDEVGLASYVYDLTADELQTQLRKLDRMMANWIGKGIVIGYPLPSSPSTSLITSETTVPDSANEAIVCNLAIRIAPSFGKVVSQDTLMSARSGYQTLLSRATMPKEMQLPGTMPLGQGNKPWRYWDDPFVSNPVDRLDKNLDWLTT
tara:strand:- start:191 stop:667 length:477 start_codon:yes stop_codon:yes gene_type:complete